MASRAASAAGSSLDPAADAARLAIYPAADAARLATPVSFSDRSKGTDSGAAPDRAAGWSATLVGRRHRAVLGRAVLGRVVLGFGLLGRRGGGQDAEGVEEGLDVRLADLARRAAGRHGVQAIAGQEHPRLTFAARLRDFDGPFPAW